MKKRTKKRIGVLENTKTLLRMDVYWDGDNIYIGKKMLCFYHDGKISKESALMKIKNSIKEMPLTFKEV